MILNKPLSSLVNKSKISKKSNFFRVNVALEFNENKIDTFVEYISYNV